MTLKDTIKSILAIGDLSRTKNPSIMGAIAQQPQPPCEVYRCEHFEVCARERLACEAFVAYVHTAKSFHPSSKIFWVDRRRLKVPKAKIVYDMKPTKEQYESLYGL